MAPMSSDGLIRLVLTEVRDLRTDISNMKVSVEHRLTKVEVKAGMWGAAGGVAVAIAIELALRAGG